MGTCIRCEGSKVYYKYAPPGEMLEVICKDCEGAGCDKCHFEGIRQVDGPISIECSCTKATDEEPDSEEEDDS